MIIEKLQNARTLLEARQQRRDEKKQLDSLEVFSEDLVKLKDRWDRIVATEPFLDVDRSMMQRVAEHVTDLAKRVSIAAARNDLAPLRHMIDELEIEALARWDTRKHQWMDSVLLNRARILTVIGTPAEVASILQFLRVLDQAFQQDSVPTRSSLDALDRIQRQLRESITVTLPSMDPEVEEFLSQLADGTARLEFVTPEILAWCREQGLTRRIVLSITGG